ncbi:MAG: hypothetical protein SGI72_07640 [Planctomycetota bacterium]|nr:hypothetical protein [Planctomycetota bacterium]
MKTRTAARALPTRRHNPKVRPLSPGFARFSPRASPKSSRVRSWVFRHRLRLRAIYGPRPEFPSEGRRSKPAAKVEGLVPGQCGRRGEWFVIRPNAPAA